MRYLLSICALLGLFFLPTACRLPDGDADEWTLVSWNLQNLFDGVDDGNEYREFDPSSGEWDQRLYHRRLQRVGEVITSCGRFPDVLVFQELEKGPILDDLAEGVLKSGDYRWRVAVPGPQIIRCGVLSRYPVSSVRIADTGFWGSRALRPALSMTLDVPGGPVRLFAVHWKSPRDGRAATESARRQEALTVREAVFGADGLQSAIPTILIGDFNTPADGQVLPAALMHWEPEVNRQEAILFSAPDREGVGIQGTVPVLFDPEPDPRYGAPGTYWYRDSWDRPDRALLTGDFIDGEGLEFQNCRAGGIRVMEDSMGHPSRWYTHLEEGYSDHFPLILTFRRDPESAGGAQ